MRLELCGCSGFESAIDQPREGVDVRFVAAEETEQLHFTMIQERPLHRHYPCLVDA